ncbi:MAG: hypothetical protein GXY08_04535 [Ruminococcus sp.]|nr:hypothetical protein [Ruminococcus sp.]
MKKAIIISMLAGLTLMAASCGKSSDSSEKNNATASVASPVAMNAEDEAGNGSSSENDELKNVAIELTDAYGIIKKDIMGGELQTDDKSVLEFKAPAPDNGDITLTKVCDERFINTDALRDFYYTIMQPSNEEYLFGGNFDKETYPEGCVLPFELSMLRYMMYDGQLYVNKNNLAVTDFYTWIDDINIEKVSDTEFTAERKYTTDCGKVKAMEFDIALEDDLWKITGIRSVNI